MEKVFLDANIVFHLAHRKLNYYKMLTEKSVYTSPLSFHILCYADKTKIPNKQLNIFIEGFKVIDFTNQILDKAKLGPTEDLEDNIQLHSAVKARCDTFLTLDKGLLKLKKFGKVKVVSRV